MLIVQKFTMPPLQEKVHQWILNELNFLSEGRSRSIPQPSALEYLKATEQNRDICNFLVDYVRCRSNAEKVRRILKVKRMEEEKKRNAFADIPRQVDLNRLQQDIVNANQLLTIKTSSLSTINSRIESIKEVIRELIADIDKLDKKSSFLKTFINDYRKKILLLNTLQGQLEAGRFIDKQKLKILRNDTDAGFNYILGLITSTIKIVLKGEENPESTIENIRNSVDQKVVTVLLADLISTLKDFSRVSFNGILDDMEHFSKDGSLASTKLNLRPPLKYLQDLKLQHVHTFFTTKKIRKEIVELAKLKDSLAENKSYFVTKKKFPDVDRRCELFSNMLEITCLKESIKHFGIILSKEQDDCEALKGRNSMQLSTPQDLEVVIKNFYSEVDLLCKLLKWACSTFTEILESISNLHTFVNKDVFASANLEHSAPELQCNLSSKVEMLWDTCKHNNVIVSMYNMMPLMKDVCNLMHMSLLKNDVQVLCDIAELKYRISDSQSNKFLFDDNKQINASECYASMLDVLHEIHSKLEEGDAKIRNCSEFADKATVALRDWWHQDAQYILDLSYKNKTLKMWQDILNLLPNFDL